MMELPSPTRNSVPVWTLCFHHWMAIVLSVSFLFGWYFGVVRGINLAVALFFLILCCSCYLGGALVLRAVPLSCFPSTNYPLAFLLGFLLLSFTLFLVALVSPLGIKFNFTVAVIGIAAWAIAAKVPRTDARTEVAFPSEYLVVLISLAAATLWAQDSIQPSTLMGPQPRLVHWPDSFYHARLISVFASQAPGAPIQSMYAAGEPARLYHYASYMLPAALSAFTRTPAYTTFSSFMLPMGIFLTGLAAYGIGTSFWGRAGGGAAAVALLLLPDAAQQGISNYWYSYHFLQHVNPGQLFGVATMAAAWIYMFDACKTDRPVSLGAGYALAAICITYKAQFFIANAFLLWVFPALFFGALSRKKRIAWVALATLSYWLALKLAEGIPAMPTIRTDVRSLLGTGEWIARNFDSEAIRAFLLQFVPIATDSRFHSVAWILGMAVIIFVITFGAFGPLYFVLAWRLRRVASRMVLLFPLFVMIVYMFMSTSLAPNANGNTDELTHRPFAWAYFVVCTWVGGATWRIVSRSLPQRNWQWAIPAVAFFLLLVPWTFGKGIEVGPTRLWTNYHVWWLVPPGLVRAAYYIREHSQPTDIVQDSEGDSRLILTGLSERQPYAVWDPANLSWIPERAVEIAKFEKLTRHEEIIDMARRFRIRWFVVHPEDELAWPQAVVDGAVFQSDGYRVYAFGI